MLEWFSTFITYLTYLLILKQSFRFLYFLYRKLLRPRKDLIERYGKDTWALVTAGSDGIGKGISEELAATGFNILIAARTEQKMVVFCDLLKSKYGVKAEYIVVDFGKIEQTFEEYQKIFGNYFHDREISILVNNVGTLEFKPQLDLTIEEASHTINLNCYPQTFLSKMYVDVRKEKGAIINLSSIAAEYVILEQNMYGATKRFNDYLSMGYALEYQNLDVISVKPGGVESPLSQVKDDFFQATSAKNCANGILNDLGYEMQTHGFWFHEVTSWILSLIPEFLLASISQSQLKAMSEKRKIK